MNISFNRICFTLNHFVKTKTSFLQNKVGLVALASLSCAALIYIVHRSFYLCKPSKTDHIRENADDTQSIEQKKKPGMREEAEATIKESQGKHKELRTSILRIQQKVDRFFGIASRKKGVDDTHKQGV